MVIDFDSTEAIDFKKYLSAEVGLFELNLSHSTLVEVIDEFQKHKRKTNKGYTVSPMRYNIIKLENEMNVTIMPNQVTDIFYSLFINWLSERGVKLSTVNLYCQQIRLCLNWAIRYNCPVHSTYDQFKVKPYERTKIALTADEVSHIAHFDINALKRRPQHINTLCQVRDMFVLACCLGQRYSDMVRIRPENFDRNTFSIRQKKTGNKAIVDIDDFAIVPNIAYKILEKYNYSAPYKGDITNYNKTLRKLMQYIGEEFSDNVIDEVKVGNMIATYEIPRFKKISSHTARRTFITYCAEKNIAEYKIRRASGHKSSSSFNKYILPHDE